MPLSKKRTYQRQSEPKLFQCTGYGDCHMVFTRSEHLARHARKHTGEKPYKCVVPGCERTFSRFDNMIQHTSTHNKKGNGDKKGVQNKKPNSNKQTNTMKTNGSQNDKSIRPQHMVSHITNPVDMGYSSLSPPPTSTLSLPGSPISDMGSPSYQRLPSITDSYFHHSPNAPTLMEFFSHITPMSPMHPTFLPSPKELLHPLYPMKSANDFDDNDALSSSASPSPASSPLSSPLSPTSILLHPSSDDLSRRLSNMELALPIQELSTCHGAGANGVNVTRDEFEALQGFSQLATRSFGANRPRSVDMGATQVNALRQSLALAHESSSRLSPRSSI